MLIYLVRIYFYLKIVTKN